MKNKGFTLIELLVVIAIIGILAGIVLTSLGSARTKAKNASAQASMSSMRAEAELNINSSGQYPDLICSTGGLGDLVAAVEGQLTDTVTCVQDSDAGSASSGWAAVVTLDGTGAGSFCVDSSGFAGSVAAETVIASARASGADVTCN